MQTKKDLISIKDLAIEEIEHIFELTDKLKANPLSMGTVLAGRSMGMIFQKPSHTTTVSF